MDLSAFEGKPMTATTLREATAVIMADVTGLLAGLRQETPPAVPFDPAAGSRSSSIGSTIPGAGTTHDAPETPAGGPEAETETETRPT